jgi:cytoskeletal protein RodZ
MERPELTASPGGPGPRASLSVRLRFLMRDRRFVVALAGAVLVLLVAVGFLAARLGDRSRPILAGASASPSASPSEAQATPSSEPTPSEEPSEEPSATPTPTISASSADPGRATGDRRGRRVEHRRRREPERP